MEFVFSATLFFLTLIVFELVYTIFKKPETHSINRIAKRYSTSSKNEDELDILYHRKFSDITLFDRVLALLPAVDKVDALMQQGGVKMLAGVFVLLHLIVGSLFFLVCSFLQPVLIFSILAGVVGLFLPFVYLFYRRSKRRAQFETLFPDALDLMGYSLKAGHSIVASFKMVSEEVADPVGDEFSRVVEELNFGRDFNSSLKGLSHRIDSAELRYFVTSVVIQRETGGNLVEMLVKISEVIRRKFRFREKVKTLAAEGKISALILLALPFFAGAAILALNPEYILILASDPIGPYVISVALLMMSIGSYIMYRLVQLDL
jgi:tight adherence protein B